MNKNLKIALIIAGIIALIYFWKKNKSNESEKSEFLGGLFSKKGGQSWANGLAKEYCVLMVELKRIVALISSGQYDGIVLKRKATIEARLQAILELLSAYAYQIDTARCIAISKGGPSGKMYRPGDKLGKDCLCKDKTTWATECCKATK